MPTVIIGAPVYQREWILPYWFEYITKQTFPLDQVGFIFQIAPNDNPTVDELIKFKEAHPELIHFSIEVESRIEHEAHPEGHRKWDPNRYHSMVRLRNDLLERVRVIQPDYYFSLDTDILLTDPKTIEELVDLTRIFPAVSPLTFMGPDNILYPSVMTWVNGIVGNVAMRQTSYPWGSVFRSDVIMAAKMMSKAVYENIDYQWHRQGEDLGWSTQAAEKGYELYCASFIYGSHQMSRAQLKAFLETGQDIRYNNISDQIARAV